MQEKTAARADVLRTRDFVGWEVRDARGEKMGTVVDLLIDRRGSVRFLDIDLGLFRRHVLLPVSQVDWGEDALVSRWSRDDLKALPDYDSSRPLTTEMLAEMARAHPRFYGEAGDSPAMAGAMPGEVKILPLRETKDFKLSAGAPDLRGWSVYASDRQKVGEVSEMLVDPAAMKVRYLAVDLSDDLFTLKEDRHVLIPADAVDLEERSRDVWISGISARDVAELPAYTGGAVDPEMEETVREAFRHRNRAD